VSPLTAILVAAVPVGVGLMIGERPGFIAGIGVVLALIAVVLVSREATDEDVTPHKFTATVAWLTVGSGLAFGLNFVLIHQAPAEAKLWPLVFARISASVLVVVIAAMSANLRPPAGLPLKLAVTAAVLDTGANVAMLLALHASLLSLAGVLMSLYPAATVLLAIVVHRPRAGLGQDGGRGVARNMSPAHRAEGTACRSRATSCASGYSLLSSRWSVSMRWHRGATLQLVCVQQCSSRASAPRRSSAEWWSRAGFTAYHVAGGCLS
jgi:hypothetical protein